MTPRGPRLDPSEPSTQAPRWDVSSAHVGVVGGEDTGAVGLSVEVAQPFVIRVLDGHVARNAEKRVSKGWICRLSGNTRVICEGLGALGVGGPGGATGGENAGPGVTFGQDLGLGDVARPVRGGDGGRGDQSEDGGSGSEVEKHLDWTEVW